MKSICGIDCTNCEISGTCNGCVATEGHPFGAECLVAQCEYALPNGQIVKFWDYNKIYVGNQLHKKNSDRCYGIIADEKYLMVSEYSGFGADAKIVVFKQWNDAENK